MMTREKAVEILTDHNRWRRGKGDYSRTSSRPKYSAKDVGEAIDYAILQLKGIKKPDDGKKSNF